MCRLGLAHFNTFWCSAKSLNRNHARQQFSFTQHSTEFTPAHFGDNGLHTFQEHGHTGWCVFFHECRLFSPLETAISEGTASRTEILGLGSLYSLSTSLHRKQSNVLINLTHLLHTSTYSNFTPAATYASTRYFAAPRSAGPQ